MRKNRSFVITHLASKEIGITIGLAKILVNFFFFCVNDIFNCALEGP